MKLDDVLEIYQLISSGTKNTPTRQRSIQVRKAGLENCVADGFNKVAFDTRRINQETDYNPRRGLQNYNRSEAFVSEIMKQKIQNFAKLRHVLEGLKLKYGRDNAWQDSNTRVLLSTLDKGLRIEQKDGDFAVSQPAQGSLDYIEELLHVRYRLGFDDLSSLGSAELEKVILSKDENLINQELNMSLLGSPLATQGQNIVREAVPPQSSSDTSFIEKLFGDARASKENPETERTVTITIKDKLGA